MRRMSAAERDELARAVEGGQIDNASAFAQAFATKHGLNPSTVRSTISRMRRERGLLAIKDVVPATGRDIERMLDSSEVDQWAVQLAAAALVKYQVDDHFRRAVDRERKKIESFYEELAALKSRALNLFNWRQEAERKPRRSPR